MPNGDSGDGFFYPNLTLMIDSYIISNIVIEIINLLMADRYIPHSRWSGDKRQSSACTPMQSDLWHYYLHGTINTGSHVSAHVFSKRVW